ncbi:MAG: hypothetical protein JOZ96_11080 [Acidobacteria bacterium]|nr:hypothetical protein [Acidobacteriota bacterium]
MGDVISVFNTSLESLGLPAETRAALEAQTSRLATITIPDELKDGTKQAVRRAVEESFVNGFRFVMLVAAALALMSAFFAWLMIKGRPRPVGEIERATIYRRNKEATG